MAKLDWSQCPAVESVPGKRSGAWVFRDTRMPVATVFENLEAGASIEEIMEWFHVTHEQVERCSNSLREVSTQFAVDPRTAAYITAMKRIETAYNERGIFP